MIYGYGAISIIFKGGFPSRTEVDGDEANMARAAGHVLDGTVLSKARVDASILLHGSHGRY